MYIPQGIFISSWRTRLMIGLFCVLMVEVGCSTFSNSQDIEPGGAFGVFPNPVARCDHPDYVPNCVVLYEGMLSAVDTIDLGVPPNEMELLRLEFDSSAQRIDLSGLQDIDVPVAVGVPYNVTVELVPTTTLGYGSLSIMDENGLVFFATSEVEQDWDVNPRPPEGWSIATIDEGATYEIGCNVQAIHQRLIATYQGQRAELVQGESVQLGDYLITALSVADLDYSEVSCVDFVAIELSYVIARVRI